jgi:hypothetical protein
MEMESNATDKPVPREITALLSDERLILRETLLEGHFGELALICVQYAGLN